jgi:putative flippase GtrA
MSKALPLVRYLLVGTLNTSVGYALILGLQFGLAVNPFLANGIGYAVGLAISYVLNRRFTFQSRRSHRSGLPAYLAAAAISYGVNALVLASGLAAGLASPLAQALAVVAYTVSFYLLARFSVFRPDTA